MSADTYLDASLDPDLEPHLDPYLDPELGERILDLSANDSMVPEETIPLSPLELASRNSQPQPSNFVGTKLEWSTVRGYIPQGAVSIYNKYTGRYDYVCKYKCEAGFYNPNFGPYCYYPYKKKEYRGSPFEILMNKDNFEFLEWRRSSFGRMPANSIATCPWGGIYVGKNRYGLGKVQPARKAFFLPWRGRSYWYRRRYEVLTMNRGVKSEYISDLKYNIPASNIFQYPPETMAISSITNNGCRDAEKQVQLSKTSSVQHSWEIGFSFSLGATISAPLPSVTGAGIEINRELTFDYSRGKTTTKEITHSVSVGISVPFNHYCKARMMGHRYKADIPFTAVLTRTYYNGMTQKTTITGTYHGVLIGEIGVIADRCTPVPYASPCP